MLSISVEKWKRTVQNLPNTIRSAESRQLQADCYGCVTAAHVLRSIDKGRDVTLGNILQSSKHYQIQTGTTI